MSILLIEDVQTILATNTKGENSRKIKRTSVDRPMITPKTADSPYPASVLSSHS
jgi:hypothetical protein